MKITPYHIIGGSSILALIILLLYFYQTSPQVTDVTPEPVKVEVTPEITPPTETVAEPEPVPNAEAGQDTELGITLARVSPDGSAVIAGNAPDGSTINIYDDGALIGSTVVAGGNEWVIVPEQPLSPGAHLLTLEIIAPDGAITIGSMALAVEIPMDGNETPLVALVPYTEEVVAEAKILQTPEPLTQQDDTVGAVTTVENANDIASSDTNNAENADPVVVPRLTIRSIQAISDSMISISGLAEGGVSVHTSVNGAAGDVVSPDDKAMYVASMPINTTETRYKLQSVLKDSAGVQVATATITLSRGQVEQSMGSNALIVVQKGDALWRIAYKTYGQGIRYIDIYRQNQNAINNPDLIYPDQVFVVPKSN